jgi:transcriptional regulator with XRE-family HTH domain
MTPTTIGERLRQAREAKGWSVEELCEAANVWGAGLLERKYYHEDEVAVSDFIRIAQALGVSLDWLLLGVEVSDRPSNELINEYLVSLEYSNRDIVALAVRNVIVSFFDWLESRNKSNSPSSDGTV